VNNRSHKLQTFSFSAAEEKAMRGWVEASQMDLSLDVLVFDNGGNWEQNNHQVP